jgi:hypothetical protein
MFLPPWLRTGSDVTGTVVDQTGGVLPVTVTALHEATGNTSSGDDERGLSLPVRVGLPVMMELQASHVGSGLRGARRPDRHDQRANGPSTVQESSP